MAGLASYGSALCAGRAYRATEQDWDELREKSFPNRIFDSIDALENHLEQALHDMELELKRVRSIVAWPWIIVSLPN